MNQSSEAAEQIVKMSLEGIEVAAKISGSGAKDIAVLLYTIMKNKEQTAGKTKLNNMLKSGKELKVFSIRQDQFDIFRREAKRYGVLYSALINKKNKSPDGIIDVMVRSEDAAKINRIVSRFKLSDYKDVTIRNEIENNRKTKNNSKGVQTKDKDAIIKENEQTKYLKKDDNTLNPSLAKTEKSPLSKPTSEKKSYSRKGINRKKDSVKKKINEYQKVIKQKEKMKQLDTKSITPKISNKTKER